MTRLPYKMSEETYSYQNLCDEIESHFNGGIVTSSTINGVFTKCFGAKNDLSSMFGDFGFGESTSKTETQTEIEVYEGHLDFVRNQNTDHHEDELVLKHRDLMARIVINGEVRGSGIMLTETLMLTCAHVFIAEANEICVEFGVYDSKSNHETYRKSNVVRILDSKDVPSIIYSGGDLALVELEDAQEHLKHFFELPTSPVDIGGSIYFMGYTGGTHLKYSKGVGLNPAVTRVFDSSMKGKRVSIGKSDGGVIEAHSPTSGKALVSPSKPSGREKKLIITCDEVSKYIKTKNAYKAYTDMSKITLVLPPLRCVDHIITSLKTAEGSSGGVYFNNRGQIIAIHCGALADDLIDYFRLDSSEIPHLAILPNAARKYSFWTHLLKLEAKPPKKKSAPANTTTPTIHAFSQVSSRSPIHYGKCYTPELDDKLAISWEDPIFAVIRDYLTVKGWVVSKSEQEGGTCIVNNKEYVKEFFVANLTDNSGVRGNAGSYALHYHVWFMTEDNTIKTILQFKDSNGHHYRVFLKLECNTDYILSLYIEPSSRDIPSVFNPDTSYIIVDTDSEEDLVYETNYRFPLVYSYILNDVRNLWRTFLESDNFHDIWDTIVTND